MSTQILGNPIVAGLLLSACIWLLTHGLMRVGVVLQQHRNAKNTNLIDALDLLRQMALTAVAAVEQSVRPTLANPNEVLTKEGQAEMKKAALDSLKTSLSASAVPSARAALQLGEDWLIAELERAVGDMPSTTKVDPAELGHVSLAAKRKLAGMPAGEIEKALGVA